VSEYIPRFPGQKDGEVVEYLVAKHWIIYVKLILFMLTTIVVPVVIFTGIELGTEWSLNAKRYVTFGFIIYMIVIVTISFIRWLEDELDVIIVTNERVISIDQVSFMHRTVSETELSQVQDVKHVAKGVLSNVMNFGCLEIQTAAEKIIFRIDDVTKPHQMSRQILDMCNVYKRSLEHNHGNKDQAREDVTAQVQSATSRSVNEKILGQSTD
jgi:hypothetical protein